MLKNFLKLITGNVIAQGTQLISLFFLTQFYLPDDFGVLGKIQSIAGIVVIILTLQLQYIIPLSINKQEAKTSCANLFQILLLLFSLFLFLSIIFLSSYYVYATVLAFMLGAISIINNYMIFNADFGKLSKFFVLRSLLIVTLQFLFYFLSVENGLLYASILGEFSAMLYLVCQYNFLIKIKFSFSNNLKLIFDWKPYTLYGTIQEIFSVLVYSLPIIFYVDKFGENIGGQYSMAYKLTWAPTVLISSSLAQILTHKFARDKNFKFIKSVFWFDKRILILMFFIFVFLYNLDSLNLLLLKGNWSVSFMLLPYMFINVVFFLFASPFRVALRVLKLNKKILIIEVITVVLMTVMFYILDISIIQFTILITGISVFQNVLIIYSYKIHEIKQTNIL